MSEAKFTPGPWEPGRPDTRTISEVHGKWIYAGDMYLAIVKENAEADTMANAYLIAAAPDLLAACEALYDDQRGPLTEAMKMAEAAIKKARGE